MTTKKLENSYLSSLKRGLSRSRSLLVDGMDKIFFKNKQINKNLLEDLEELLISADMGVRFTLQIIDDLRKNSEAKKAIENQELKGFIKGKILKMLVMKNKFVTNEIRAPFVSMVVGVNGSGKTTTIGKLAYRYTRNEKKVLLAAGDTFRAAASEQLKIWAERADADFISHKNGADPAAVVFDSMKAAKARGVDMVLVDTAGRLHTNSNLMEQLKKIRRVVSKEIEDAPHEVLLVMDATTGQNGLLQAKMFHEALNITGIALTKLDSTSKGGIIVQIIDELNIPVKYVGLGEGLEDLRIFYPEEFVDALFK